MCPFIRIALPAEKIFLNQTNGIYKVSAVSALPPPLFSPPGIKRLPHHPFSFRSLPSLETTPMRLRRLFFLIRTINGKALRMR